MTNAPDHQPYRAPVVAQPTASATKTRPAAARAANRYDIRRMIAGVFALRSSGSRTSPRDA